MGKIPRIVPFRAEGKNNNVVLFVHGFSGEAETTFGNIPQYLSEEESMKGWDMFSIGYSSDQMPSLGIGIWAAIPDIQKVADFLKTTIQGQFSNYSRVAIIAHSMGGLAVQRAVIDMDKAARDKISYLMLYGTPSNGLEKVSFFQRWNRQLRDMYWDGEFIKGLRQSWTDTFPGQVYPFKFKVVAGTDDEFVPISSSQANFDKKYCETVSGNHLAIVKPNDKNHAGYQLILATLINKNFVNNFTDKEAVNLLLGNYTQVVNDLLPAKYQLSKEGVVKLIFALEGLNRNDEAVEILENTTITGNSDLLGILGGRYKRKYLLNYKAADAEKSFEHYSKALALSEQNTNDEQIFYHAINLAFLSLVYKDDKAQMKKYAQTAKDAAGRCAEETWKNATIAEAAIYFDDPATALVYFAKAADNAQLRAKLSMYANAYNAYTCLKNPEEESDEFIKALKEKLLH
jgi:hypothetical protein